MSETPKTVFVTKYALSGGIVERETIRLDPDGVIWVRFPGAPNNQAPFWPNDYRATRADAIARADEMRVAKAASLRKQIAKLEAMTFA